MSSTPEAIQQFNTFWEGLVPGRVLPDAAAERPVASAAPAPLPRSVSLVPVDASQSVSVSGRAILLLRGVQQTGPINTRSLGLIAPPFSVVERTAWPWTSRAAANIGMAMEHGVSEHVDVHHRSVNGGGDADYHVAARSSSGYRHCAHADYVSDAETTPRDDHAMKPRSIAGLFDARPAPESLLARSVKLQSHSWSIAMPKAQTPEAMASHGATNGHRFGRFFADVANFIAREAGRPWVFMIALGTVIIWTLTGPIFNFSDTATRHQYRHDHCDILDGISDLEFAEPELGGHPGEA